MNFDDRLFLQRVYEGMKKFSRNIDLNFFNGLMELLNLSNNIIGDFEITSDELIERLSLDQGCDREQLIELAMNFFGLISPLYKKQFENLISEEKMQLVNNKELSMVDSMSDKLILTGNYCDFYILIHESTHNFHNLNNNSALFHLLGETDAICMELLAADYLKKQPNINQSSFYDFYALREISLKEDFFHDHRIQAFINLFSNQKNENTDFNNDSLNAAKKIFPYTPPSNSSSAIVFYTYIVSGFSHQIGYILANYIHEKILENPNNIKMLEAVIQALSLGEEQEEEAIKILSQSNIPIIRDGKLSLDSENIKLLEIYLKKSHERIKSDKTDKCISHSSLATKQNIINKLVQESISGIPNLATLDELEENLKEQEILGKEQNASQSKGD